MPRYSYRSPILHLSLYFVLGLAYALWNEIERLFEPDDPSADVYGLADYIVGPSIPGAVLMATFCGIVPAIGSLAGLGLVTNHQFVPWPRVIAATMFTLAPVVAVLGVREIVGQISDTNVPSAIGVWPELVIPLLGIVWILMPVLLTKYLYEK